MTAIARSELQLQELAEAFPGRIVPVVADLTGALTLPDLGHEVVILNAATYAPGGLLDPEHDVFTSMWELNVLANHRLARQLLPPMIERGGGHLVVIGSSATDETSTHMTAYGTTKKALRALFEGWTQELAGTGVRATLVAPGATLTSSWDGEIPPPVILAATEVAELVHRVVVEGLTGRMVIKAET